MRKLSKLIKINLMRFLRNLYNLFLFDIKSHQNEIKKLENEIKILENGIEKLSNHIEKQKNLLCGHNIALKYLLEKTSYGKDILANELKYIIENGFSNFPYKQIKKCETVISGFDITKKLPFVEHKNKRLYFPQDFSVELASSIYKNFIERECILGGNYTEKSPHQYQTENFKIEQGDVLIDVGSAEALLALDSIDSVSHAYLIEGDPLWFPALEATFEPYAEKVTIINKYIGLGKNDISLQEIVEKHDCGVFIKMDIEGAEVNVLNDTCDFLSKRKNTKIVCCTYHKNDDFEKITSIITKMGYEWECSEGYMLFNLYDNPEYPYFRIGVVRAMSML